MRRWVSVRISLISGHVLRTVCRLMLSDEPLHLHASFIDDTLYTLEVDPSPET